MLHSCDVVFLQHKEGCEETTPLGDDCAECHTFYFHAESIHQTETRNDICAVLTYSNHHRSLGILHAYIPSVECEESE